MQRWKRPDYYMGADWPEYFVFLGRTRDSGLLDQSNFEVALRALGGESETVLVVRESHWAVGWIEWIAIHESDAAAIAAADEMECALSDYPILDESDFSEREFDAAASTWERARVRDRLEWCQRAGLSIFAARRDYLPADHTGALFELLTN